MFSPGDKHPPVYTHVGTYLALTRLANELRAADLRPQLQCLMALETCPLSLYVHFPWCQSKCPYCDFNSHRLKGSLPQAQYVKALIVDLERDLERLPATPTLQTVFLGGGTPSLFEPAQIERLLTAIDQRIPFSRDAEITLEANPGTLEPGKPAGYRRAGVSRLSLGAQTFHDVHLQSLGRIHDSAEIEAAVRNARRAGFRNLNLDVMYALPGQTLDEALADMRRACALEPEHISHYQLTLEPNTRFYHQPPRLPDDDVAWEMQTACQELLAARGYQHYEVSAYAKPGFECRHNVNYWHYGDYLGIGAGAHGKLTDASLARVVRLVKPMEPREFMVKACAAGPIAHCFEVPPADRFFEFMLNALRLRGGFQEALFEARTGLELSDHAAVLERAARVGLLTKEGEAWRATELGLRFLNDLLGMFLPEAEPASVDERAKSPAREGVTA